MDASGLHGGPVSDTWTLAAQVPLWNHARDGTVCAMSFDPYEELLWNGGDKGRVSSLFCPTAERYTAFRAHQGPIRQLLVADQGVVSLASTEVRVTNRRGLPKWTSVNSPSFQDMFCMSIGASSSEVLLAGAQDFIVSVNINTGTIMREVPGSVGTVIMKRGRLICCGSSQGTVSFRDPNTLRVEHTFPAHTGTISDLDVSDNYLLTCGFSKRTTNDMVADPFVKVYDIRMMRPLLPVAFPNGPSLLRFHPKLSSTAIVSSQTGLFQVIDITNTSGGTDIFQMDTMGNFITCMDISSSGDIVAFGDSAGIVHEWIYKTDAHVNPYSRPSEWGTIPDPPTVKVGDSDPLSMVGMPYYTERLCSAIWPRNLAINAGKPSPRIPADILASMKMVDFVGYAPNPGRFLRNQVSPTSTKGTAKPKFRSEQEKERIFGKGDSKEESLLSGGSLGHSAVEPPSYYRQVEIEYSKFGVEDFDFGYYNKTEFGGLETHIANSYCNAMLQVLFHSSPMCEICKGHMRLNCLKEYCLACELGFLFRMLEDAKGLNCQATNFLRAFRTIPQATALGLVQPEHSLPKGTVSYSALIQNFHRFILEHLNLECNVASGNPVVVPGLVPPEGKLPSPIQQTYGLQMDVVSMCQVCTSSPSKPSVPFVVDLRYPRKPTGRAAATSTAGSMRTSFCDVLVSSIRRENTTKAWCEKCGSYELITQTRYLRNLPSVLSINAATVLDEEIEHWRHEPQATSWLPAAFIARLQGEEIVLEEVDLAKFDGDLDETSTLYRLQSTVVEINDGKRPPHLVTHVNVGDAESSWYLFNDFLVRPVAEEEVLRYPKWKNPATVTYVRYDMNQITDFSSLPRSLDLSLLTEDTNLVNRKRVTNFSYTKFRGDELVNPAGKFIAIDAEFVALTKEESEIHSDGTRSIVRPSRLGLARVSVLRGEGPEEAVPFIDDYVVTSEPIIDYLTEFSGIKPADLDPASSKHALVTLKSAYKKLRLLVDLGFVFVGHGLSKDFRTINILVPPKQVIDTVDIYYLSNRQRKLSLRFLSWYFLQEKIQAQSHDSIEDARTALALYRKYESLSAEGDFLGILEEMYEEGRNMGFRAP